MGGYAFTLEEQQTMVAMAKRGIRAPVIAEQIGRHRASISVYLRQCGFRFRHGPDKTEPKVRFEAFLPADRKSGECWAFQGFVDEVTGYGSFAFDGIHAGGAHVASYRIYKGDVPKGMIVCHTCDNRPCVNPDHLVLGTQLDNMAGCMERNRIAKGEAQGLSVMTEDRVRDLRRQYAAGATQVSLSENFGISQPTVSQIIRRATWKHVP